MVKENQIIRDQAYDNNDNSVDNCKKPRKYTKIKKNQLPKEESNIRKPYKKSKSKVQSTISFLSNISQELDQIDFALYNSMMEKRKLISICLLDKNGKFIFYNSLARQHFQGSLNDLEKYSFFDLIAMISKQQIMKTLQSQFDQKIIKYCIYSKNTKRKYSKMQVSNAHCQELYLKYLKTLCSRIRPIKFKLSKDNILKQHWNKQFTKDYQTTYELFLLETRHSKKILTYDETKIFNDPVIIKFEKNLKKKMDRIGDDDDKMSQIQNESSQSEIQEEDNENENIQQNQPEFENHPEDKYLQL